MQSKTRYISIQLGIGGYQTIPSDEVERTGYGDCKALTNYMKAMLDYLKIPCNYVLVSAGSDVPDILYDFPSNQFNHVFLAVPMLSDTLWYECTSQTLPPAHIGTFTDDRHVLWIDKGKSNIVHTPVYSAIQSTMRRHCTVKLQPQGDAMLDLLIIETGMFFDEAMAFQNLPKDYVEKHNNSKFTYKDFSIKSFDYKIPDANHAELNLNYKINVNGLGKSLGTKMILPYNLLTPIDKDMPLDIMNKKSEIRRAYTIEDYTDIIPSEFYRVNVMPQAIKEVTEFGTFEMNITTDEKDVIHVYRKTIINKGIYENESFDRFHEVIKKIRAVEQSKIVLQSKT